jgi:preprotein translocase subunit SecF
MPKFRLVADGTTFPFVRYQYWAYLFSLTLVLVTLGLLWTKGLNYGIDFKGGLLLEVGMEGPADLAAMRADLGKLQLGEVALQTIGSDANVLIRVERQAAGAAAERQAVEQIKAALTERYQDEVSFRRIETVGAKVSADLLRSGIEASVLSLLAILAYLWFRFEWQYAVGAIVALAHDAIATVGLFAALGLEFNLTSVAALLTIVGYSVNDTVVIYDRIRSNLRRYKTIPLGALIDRSINETLSRTVMTSFTTLLALFALAFLGGPALRDFSIAMIWGVVVGTYSSVYVATPMVLHMNLQRDRGGARAAPAAGLDGHAGPPSATESP